LALAGVVVVSQAASSNVLIAVGRHRLVTFIWLAEAAANLVLSLWLVRSYGLLGVAVGTLAPVVFGHLGVLWVAASRAVGMSLRQSFAQTVRPAAVAGAIAALGCWVLRDVSPPASAPILLMEGSAVAALYVASLMKFGLDGETRRMYAAQCCRAGTVLAA